MRNHLLDAPAHLAKIDYGRATTGVHRQAGRTRSLRKIQRMFPLHDFYLPFRVFSQPDGLLIDLRAQRTWE